MTYLQALEYLNSFLNYEQVVAYRYPNDFSLDRMERLLDRLGNPHLKFPSIHVAGTKGKGSTCALVSSILQAHGLRVGLYTSPHLISLRERIQVDRNPILEEELAGEAFKIRACLKEDVGPGREPTFFEVTTACAFQYFARRKVDVAVVEVGLGGRLDATNVLTPRVTALSPISFDHMAKLGNTLSQIAREKAGILKPGIPAVTALQPQEALETILEAAYRQGVPLHRVEKEVTVRSLRLSPEGSAFTLQTPRSIYPDLFLPLLGRHQVMNASVAIRIAELWQQLDPSAVRQGIRQVRWPGRCELIDGPPAVLLDGAQNAASALALKDTVQELFPGRRIILILGTSLEKDLEGIAAALGPWAWQLLFTQASVPRAESPQRIAQSFKRWFPDPRIFPSVEEALEATKAYAGSDDLIVVTGSLFVVGEARQALQMGRALEAPRRSEV